MKTIGLIGGLSWQSTHTYYHIINTEMNKILGKNHSAKILMYSFDFEEIEFLQKQSEWDKLNDLMAHAGKIMENAGADFLLICSNTMHDCATYLESKINIPLLHIADAVGDVLNQQNIWRAGLLGTKFLMQSETYTKRLEEEFNKVIVIPDLTQREMINDIIYLELVKGIIEDQSRAKIMSVIENLIDKGIEAIVLGCTEIPLIIKQDNCQIPVIDTTDIHAKSAVKFAIST
jgi:aspartate racemase